MAKKEKFITDEKWKKLEALLPKHKQSPKGRRKPAGNREVFEGIIWVLRNGARWKDVSLHRKFFQKVKIDNLRFCLHYVQKGGCKTKMLLLNH